MIIRNRRWRIGSGPAMEARNGSPAVFCGRRIDSLQDTEDIVGPGRELGGAFLRGGAHRQLPAVQLVYAHQCWLAVYNQVHRLGLSRGIEQDQSLRRRLTSRLEEELVPDKNPLR